MDRKVFDWDAPWVWGVMVVKVGEISMAADGEPFICNWVFKEDSSAPPLSANDLVQQQIKLGYVPLTSPSRPIGPQRSEWFFCKEIRGDKCESCRYRFLCWTNKKHSDILSSELATPSARSLAISKCS